MLVLTIVFLQLIFSAGGGDNRESDSSASNSKVLELTEENFDKVISDTPLILIEFYAPWCEYCQILEPKYEAAAEELSLLDPPIPLARVDGDKQKNLYNRMGLNGYPSIFVFHNGRHFEYEGLRRRDAIVDFMKEEAKPDWKPPEEHVIELTTENFAEIVSSKELMLVEFYAPWCGHCKRLAPDYARAAKELNLKHDIPLAKVDATEETSLAKMFHVDGYPTLLIFRYGKEYQYDGPRDRKGIVEFMVNQSIPETQSFSTRKELDLFLAGALNPVVVTILPDGEKGEFWEAYLELANLGRKTPLHFRHSTQLSLSNGFGLPRDGGVVVLKSSRFISEFEPALSVIEGSLMENNVSRILGEITNIARPTVGLRSKSNEYWWSYPMVVVYLTIDTSPDGKKDFIYWRNRLLPVAHALQGKLQVVMSDEVEYADELGELGLNDLGEDIVIALWSRKKEKYVMKEEFDEDSLLEFTELYFDGRLRPVLRSQRKHKQKGPVKVVVGSTFDQVVYDQEKDVLIEFYAPWCGHCKSLEPKYKQLAKHFKKYEDLIIAKFDATANDAPPEFEFEGFPTIFFVAAGELQNVVKYEGGREVQDFTSFLKENAVHSLRQEKRKTDEL